MKQDIGKNRDFWAGIMLIGTGSGAIYVARDYVFGSSLKMGPGYFPSVLGGILILFGIYISLMGLRSKVKIKETISLRALIMLPISLILFGVLMQYTGFLPALVVLVFGSAFAGREFKFLEVLILTGFLALLSWSVFIWGMGLPYPLISGFL